MITAPMPAVSGVVKHSAKGPVWYSGPVASARSVPLSGSNWNTAVSTCCICAACAGSIGARYTPLGRPVVPEV